MIEGLTGEVFDAGGKVGIAIPPAGRDGAIRFEVVRVHPPGPGYPAWADILVDGACCRMNPAICEPPFHRLADCVMVAHTQRRHIPAGRTAARVTLPPAPHPDARNFLFWRVVVGGREVVMVVTEERVERHSGTAPDGQTRHRGGFGRR